MKPAILASLLSFAVLTVGVAGAQEVAPKGDAPKGEIKLDPMSKYILDTFKVYEGKTMCAVGNIPIADMRLVVAEYFKTSGAGSSVAPADVDRALWTLFPCPFSPIRSELVPATGKDLPGVWLFPEDSQPYRFGPRSEKQPTKREQAITCEAVGYYPKGELRTATAVGIGACPFQKAADLAPARKRARALTWTLLAKGRLKVTAADTNEPLEDWDTYKAVKPFQILNLSIAAGDLVAYKRWENGNDVNAATEFRHLQHLK
jgi:hypothetical protein